MKNIVKKYRPCNARAISIAIMSFGCLFVLIAGIFPAIKNDKEIFVFFIIIFFVLFLLNIFVMLYLILKLNSLIYITQKGLLQKQFTKIVVINYDDVTDVKLSFAYYAKVPYAIKIYASNKKIMFEVTGKIFDEFMNNCSNFEVTNKINELLEEKDIVK